jgi:myo-inositol catabolism protein IolC
MDTTHDDVMSGDEERAFTIFMTAVERYLATIDEDDQAAFEKWLDEHVDDEEMLAHILQTYPKFGDIFAEEIEKTAVAPAN